MILYEDSSRRNFVVLSSIINGKKEKKDSVCLFHLVLNTYVHGCHKKGNLVIKMRWMVKNPKRKKSSYIIIIRVYRVFHFKVNVREKTRAFLSPILNDFGLRRL